LVWLFRWLLPVAAPNAVHTPGNGTRVVVF